MKNLLIVLSFLFCFQAQADTFFVETVQGQELSAQDKNSVRELIKLSLPAEHKATDNSQQAQWVLTPRLLKLGKAYILNLEKKNTKSGAVYSDKMKSAKMSDMDLTAGRLTRAVIEEKSVTQMADVTNITLEETQQNTNRIQNTRQWLIGLGPSWTNNLNSSGGGFTFLLGFEWGLDPDFSVDLSWLVNNGRGDDDSSFSDFSVGGSYYFSRGKYTPFVNVRLGYGNTSVNDNCYFLCSTIVETSDGWSGSVAVGYKLFRTSSVNVAPFIRYTYIFDKGTLGNANMTSVMFAIYY